MRNKDYVNVIAEKTQELIDELNQAFPGVGVSFIDQNQLPSI